MENLVYLPKNKFARKLRYAETDEPDVFLYSNLERNHNVWRDVIIIILWDGHGVIIILWVGRGVIKIPWNDADNNVYLIVFNFYRSGDLHTFI